MKHKYHYDVCVVGGGGHIGLPLSVMLAYHGKTVLIYDPNKKNVEHIFETGQPPFVEYGLDKYISNALPNISYAGLEDIQQINNADTVIICIGTNVDEYMHPELSTFPKLLEELIPYLKHDAHIIIRSTVFPGTTNLTWDMLREVGKACTVSYCPERISEGWAAMELPILPQIISGTTPKAVERSIRLFASTFSPETIETPIAEAELIKLFCNAHRYIQFAIANEFNKICDKYGVEYDELRYHITHHYPRMSGLPAAGFAAGPCLFKDTMQLYSAFPHFQLGLSAMLTNEGYPDYIVEKLKSEMDLKGKTVGILGMTFKPDVDDTRDSLSFKLKKLLEFNQAKVLCSDPFIPRNDFVNAEELRTQSDIIIVAVPHDYYEDIYFPPDKKVIHVWK